MTALFVFVPSLHPTGPVKGAIALANALAAWRETTLVPVKPGPGAQAPVDPRVRVLSPTTTDGRREVRDALAAAGAQSSAAIVSYCLSADLLALRLRRYGRWISSVRGNLPRNYRFDYGRLGPLLAALHLTALRRADAVTAMTRSMSRQVRRYAGPRVSVIGNFVDEGSLDGWRRPPPDGPARLVFVGSLSARKRPVAVVDACARLRDCGYETVVDLIGDGPLGGEVEAAARDRAVADRVARHGFVQQPIPHVAAADALVLPSLSEGLSRAVLEALHLGIPVVARDVDGVRDVVTHGTNGFLFEREADLPQAIRHAVALRRAPERPEASLLPESCRQIHCARQFLELAES